MTLMVKVVKAPRTFRVKIELESFVREADGQTTSKKVP
jgi:hypothetical protein